MCSASAGTACATASVLVAAHGADTAGAGFAQLITGEEALPFGVQLVMRATGLDQTQASLAYDLMAIGFELNAVRSIAAQGYWSLAVWLWWDDRTDPCGQQTLADSFAFGLPKHGKPNPNGYHRPNTFSQAYEHCQNHSGQAVELIELLPI
ncbi:hypothetical protein [Pseudovibrio sp. SPO723]|uniref:hypothetical protein n=1 Tax=Nesiotobacter zosterae TaxID=392721 RepID=UPI0029C26351|nr:hypothetical protein [Pseudovibrio sp. SPO723]MDX5595469.1 hypothetical protein [Pseudovibrio sp. SPO723]